MQIEISQHELTQLVAKQIDNLFMLRGNSEKKTLEQAVDITLSRCEYCFSHTKNKYYSRYEKIYFNPFHSGQYSIFLYFLSNSLFSIDPIKNRTLADRVYYLNKCLNGLDLFYEINMPKVFFLDHPVGSVIGRADYGEFFSFSQNCTIGNNKGFYPKIGSNVRI